MQNLNATITFHIRIVTGNYRFPVGAKAPSTEAGPDRPGRKPTRSSQETKTAEKFTNGVPESVFQTEIRRPARPPQTATCLLPPSLQPPSLPAPLPAATGLQMALAELAKRKQ